MFKQLISVLVIFSFFASAEAAIWENIPVFPQAQKVKQEEMTIDGNPAQSSIYTTQSPPEEVVEFYKTKLGNFGWELKSDRDQRGVKLLIFYKKDKMLNLIVQSMLGKNYITLTQSQLPETTPGGTTPCPACEKKKQELIEKLKLSEGTKLEDVDINQIKGAFPQESVAPEEDTPGRDLQLVPRYPGAVRASAMERDNGKKMNLSYYTQHSIDDVVNFYRQNMPNYYWKSVDELDFQNLPAGMNDKVGVDIAGQSLVFKSPSASCIISITEEPQTKGTVIGIAYNEK